MEKKSIKSQEIFGSEEEQFLVWENVQSSFEKNFGTEVYSSWLKNISLLKEYNDYLVLGVPTRFFRDWIVSRYLDKILAQLRIAIGRVAPDFSWTENGKELRLSSLKDGLSYVLIFYSTGCSHCLREVPEIFDYMKSKTNTKVIAFAMETSAKTWTNYQLKMPGWHHVLGLGKWENTTARTYQINSTPTYFVLGMDKEIISIPKTLDDLKLVLRELN